MNRNVVLGGRSRAGRTLSAEDAVARAYYAILHPAKAALSVHDVMAESNSSVRGMFVKHLILTGAIERTWSKQLAASLDDRLAADYDAATFFSAKEARHECGSARAFVGRIRRHLITRGFTDDALTAEARNG